MSLQIVEIVDSHGDLVDIAHFCSTECYMQSIYQSFEAYHPISYETDYDVFCDKCSEHIQHGLLCQKQGVVINSQCAVRQHAQVSRWR